ncbi:CMGC protein kinase [Polytolypa hystricis UAMH7299]|uniref:CMGC protein kinase n=1 Tax=Polytolypa hystricis (strain UAMH7299) TaxID=1447883 RepID=A0A2B7Z257_POLH7|nr:CMGC protein kinase [Polytolypa hystricis UAMH7299]
MERIRKSKHICALLDTVADFDPTPNLTDPTPGAEAWMAFEWMDHSLVDFEHKYLKDHPWILQIASRQILKALGIYKEPNLIHTDLKHENILVSNINSPEPIVKLADLGATIPEGYNKDRIQLIAIRAPEVWRHKGGFHVSDVWSLGVTLTDCLLPVPIFGTRDNTLKIDPECWCVAKIFRLFYQFPRPLHRLLQSEWELAAKLANPQYKYMEVGTMDDELRKLELPEVIVDFVMSLLVVDDEKRPTAQEALKHPFFQAKLEVPPDLCWKIGAEDHLSQGASSSDQYSPGQGEQIFLTSTLYLDREQSCLSMSYPHTSESV